MAVRKTRQQIEIDDSELRTLEVDLARAPGRVQRQSTRALKYRVGPMVADEMREDARAAQRSSPSSIRHLPKSVSHEMIDDWTVEVGLGPRRGKTQGALAHILVYGSVNNAPLYDHMDGPRRALPRVERILGDVAEDSVLGGAE